MYLQLSMQNVFISTTKVEKNCSNTLNSIKQSLLVVEQCSIMIYYKIG